jgi:hypothetical protein
MRPLSRAPDRFPVQALRTFQIAAPVSTHRRAATCREVQCDGWRNGFVVLADESTELGQRQAYYIRMHSGRLFTVRKHRDGRTAFVFGAETECFSAHTVPLERPALYVVRDGDHRGNPTGMRRQHASPDDWVDEFANNQDKLAERQKRG